MSTADYDFASAKGPSDYVEEAHSRYTTDPKFARFVDLVVDIVLRSTDTTPTAAITERVRLAASVALVLRADADPGETP